MVKYKFWKSWSSRGDHNADTEHIVHSDHKRSLRRGGTIQVEISNKGLLSRKTLSKLYCSIDGHLLLLAKNSESVNKKGCLELDLSKARAFHVFKTATRGPINQARKKTISPFIEIIDQSGKKFRLYFTNDEQFDYWREPLNRIFHKYYMYPRKNSCELDELSMSSDGDISSVGVANNNSTEYKDVGSDDGMESSYHTELNYDPTTSNLKNHAPTKLCAVSPPGTMDEERMRLENEAYEREMMHRINMLKQRRENLKNHLGLSPIYTSSERPFRAAIWVVSLGGFQSILQPTDGDDEENDESLLGPTDLTLQSEVSSRIENRTLVDINMNDSGLSKEITPDLTPIEKYSCEFEFGDNERIIHENDIPHTMSVSDSSESGVVCRESPDDAVIPIKCSKMCPDSPHNDHLSNFSICDLVPKPDDEDTPKFAVPLYPIPFTKMIDMSTSIRGSCLSLASFIQNSNQVSPQRKLIRPGPLSPYKRQEYNEAKCAAKKLFFSSNQPFQPSALWPKYASCQNLKQSQSLRESFPDRNKCEAFSVNGRARSIILPTPPKLPDGRTDDVCRHAVTPSHRENLIKSIDRDVSTCHASLTYGPIPYKATIKTGYSAQPTKVTFGEVSDFGKKTSISELLLLNTRCCKSTPKKCIINGASPVSYVYTPVNITCKLCRT